MLGCKVPCVPYQFWSDVEQNIITYTHETYIYFNLRQQIYFNAYLWFQQVQCVAEVINYGPIVTKLHFAKGTVSPPWLSLKLCGKLNPGESGKLEAIFSPTNLHFVELEQTVETSFNLEVHTSIYWNLFIPIVRFY